MLLPSWFPLNIYSMSSWARETRRADDLLLMTNSAAHAGSPRSSGVDELWLRPPTAEDLRVPALRVLVSWANAFLGDRRASEARSGAARGSPLRAARVARAIEWILRRQDPTGSGAASSRRCSTA